MAKEEITLWIEQSFEDFKAAQYNLKGKQFHVTALLVQQAVEKGLKALFIKKFGEVPKVHDLVFLAKRLDLPEKLLHYCKKISPFYIETRYPDAKGFRKTTDFTLNECKEALNNCEEILRWIKLNI
ncbi:MAG TPA: HEPN domain-containing protein [Candidatus Nanoarchaeia archaeon]|nr:HEPN domain-containing protein [Candidatus Nanoarchaeia archaeon]